MRWKLAEQRGLTVLRLSRCCSTLKLSTRPSRTTSKLAVDGAREPQGREQIRKRRGNVFAGAGIEARSQSTLVIEPGSGLHADAVPFPFRQKIFCVERGEIARCQRVGEHHRPERSRIPAGRFVRAPSSHANNSR